VAEELNFGNNWELSESDVGKREGDIRARASKSDQHTTVNLFSEISPKVAT
jgi:hypothetical protein